jgi:hypothetical protein
MIDLVTLHPSHFTAASMASGQPLLPITTPATLASIKTYKSSHPLTVVIASYPKSGTTWMQAVVFELLTLRELRASGDKVELDHISNFVPFLENDKCHVHESNSLADNFEQAHAKVHATVFNTHLYLSDMPAVDPNSSTRYLYMTRTARDVCNSFFHHLSHQALEDGGFAGSRSEFVKEWASGRIAFGSWGGHLKAWLTEGGEAVPVNEPGDCLRVEYEAMKKDLGSTVRDVAAHLGMEALSDEEVADMLPRLSVDYMKQNIDKYEPKSVKWVDKKDGFQFIRAGNVGEGRKSFSEEDESVFVQGFEDFPPPTGCAHLLA